MESEVTFKHPPVVETVLGIQFDRVRGLTNAHLGAFWQQRKADWPQIEDALPLEEQFEAFSEQVGWNRALLLKLTRSPLGRVQMRNAVGDRMIQLQNCRLDYNWIGQPEQEYPRYRTVRPEFDKVLQEFRNLLSEHDLEDMTPNQWEVTYVNHMPRGTVWSAPQDWAGVFDLPSTVVAVPQDTQFESFGGHWHFEIKPQRGRLHIELQHALVERPDKQEVLVMKLTARGPIEKGKDQNAAIDEGLNLGHDVIVRSFRDLTSPQAHDYWNKEI